MKIYLEKTVWEAALERIRWVFDEFDHVVASTSGGKDSTVTVELALKVARERGRTPLPVMFIDQEAEWQSTIDVIRDQMYREEVEPRWYQMPIVMRNAATHADTSEEQWHNCWNPDADLWMREKEECSIKENVYGTQHFKSLFSAIPRVEYGDQSVAYLAGVRTEKSPVRHMALTCSSTYKGATWGKHLNKNRGHYTFFPLYDWSYSDIWKAIIDNGWTYNDVYRSLMGWGVPACNMRVSNLHHEKSVKLLFKIQEIEPDTYERLVKRLPGADMAGKFGNEQFFVHNLPFVFDSWREYRDYLTEHLLPEDEKERFRKKWRKLDQQARHFRNKEELIKCEIQTILTTDIEFVKLDDFLSRAPYFLYRQYLQGRIEWDEIQPKDQRYIDREAILQEGEEDDN